MSLPTGRLEDPASTPSEPITHWRGLRLTEFQVRAIAAIRAGRNVLVSAPTGAGKTLVAEYAIEDAIRSRRRCIYTSPIKALSNQKYRDFRDDPRVDVGLVTGDVTIHPAAQVRIMTTEILRNAIFEDPRSLSDVEYVVFDEIHFLDDPERGTVWEEALIFAPPSVRVICLSATISNSAELGAWMAEIRSREIEVIETERRPVPLSHRLWHPRARAFALKELASVRRRLGRPTRRRDGDRRRPAPARSTPPRLDELLDGLEADGLLPALVFSFSRRDTEGLAAASSRRRTLDPGEALRMERLQRELAQQFQLDESVLSSELFAMARRGISYHHAGMLPIHKELVERMFTSGLLKLLFTTETFALGINMPARTVVFCSLRKFDGVSVEYMRTREYLQMAGRAGRQGIDQQGLVYSVLDDRDLFEAPLERLLRGQPEPVESRFRLSYSSILHLLASVGRERLIEAWEKSFHEFQHREQSPKQRRRARARQRRLIEAHLAFLEQHGFVEGGDALTPKGRVARAINPHEVQTAELLFRGTLEHLPPDALAVVFVALIYEERRRGRPASVPQRLYGGLRRQVSGLIGSLCASEASFGIPTPMKAPDWGLTPAVIAWCQGAGIDELEELGGVGPGDICRNLRMAVQLMRQVRLAIDPQGDLHQRLGEARRLVNRDEIDARRQLELG